MVHILISYQNFYFVNSIIAKNYDFGLISANLNRKGSRLNLKICGENF